MTGCGEAEPEQVPGDLNETEVLCGRMCLALLALTLLSGGIQGICHEDTICLD